MKILIDMNLSPAWAPVLEQGGHTAIPWSAIGAPNAPDREVLHWARINGAVVFTHDLDFGAILAATRADAPSVIQVRVQDITPGRCKDLVLAAAQRFHHELAQGALVSIDVARSRVRLLPLRR